MDPPAAAGWRQSSRCDNDHACVQVLGEPNGVWVRDANPTPPLFVPIGGFTAFLAAVKADEFNPLAC
jgi:Domain of unknown function (DUF397)